MTTSTGPWTSIIEDLEKFSAESKLSVNNLQYNNITFTVSNTEMIRVAQDGFYIRGAKVPVDDKEAETVYNAFKQFLVWSELHRS